MFFDVEENNVFFFIWKYLDILHTEYIKLCDHFWTMTVCDFSEKKILLNQIC